MAQMTSLIQFGSYVFPAGFRLASRKQPTTIEKADLLGISGVRIAPGLADMGEINIEGMMGGGDYSTSTGLQMLTMQDFALEANAIATVLNQGYQQLTIGEVPTRYCYAQKRDFEVDHDAGYGRWTGSVKMTLVTQDPRWLSTTVHSATLPSGTTSIGNAGSANTYPTFTITGPAINPSISIAQAGGAMTFQPTITMSAVDTLVIQTDPRSASYAVQLNSAIRMDLIGTNAFTNTLGSTAAAFPYLTPGTWNCTVLLGGSGTCVINWQDAWWL